MKVEKHGSNIYHVIYPFQKQLSGAFLRIVEHGSSPEFKGRIFTHEEYLEWHAKNKGIAYEDVWEGFGVASHELIPFFEGRFDPLTSLESELISCFDGVEDDYFVIGTSVESDPETCLHEMAHALFFVNQDYRKGVKNILSGIRSEERQSVHQCLLQDGYRVEDLEDESHAYLMFEPDFLEKCGINGFRLRRKIRHLKDIFDQYCPKSFLTSNQ